MLKQLKRDLDPENMNDIADIRPNLNRPLIDKLFIQRTGEKDSKKSLENLKNILEK